MAHMLPGSQGSSPGSSTTVCAQPPPQVSAASILGATRQRLIPISVGSLWLSIGDRPWVGRRSQGAEAWIRAAGQRKKIPGHAGSRGSGWTISPARLRQGLARKKVKSLSHIQIFATPWTVACQIPLSMGFFRQEYWSGLPFPSPGDLPNPGMETGSPALQGDSLPSEPPGACKHLAKAPCRCPV